MNSNKDSKENAKAKEIAERLTSALNKLRSSQEEVPLERVRAIYACASNLIETVKIEAMQSATNQEKP